MEALLFMLDSLAMVLVVFMGLRDDRRQPDAPHTGLFRMRDEPARAKAASRDGRAGAAGKPAEPSWADWERAESTTP